MGGYRWFENDLPIQTPFDIVKDYSNRHCEVALMIRYYLNLSNAVAAKLKGKSHVHLLAIII